MEQLLKLHHIHVNLKNAFQKYWDFNMNNSIYTLMYNKYETCDNFYFKNVNEKMYTHIYNIDEWLNEHLIFIQNSVNNYIKCIELVEYINTYTSATLKTCYKIEWYIPSYLKLTMHFYEKNEPYILLESYKNKVKQGSKPKQAVDCEGTVVLSEEKLKIFLQKNKKKMQEKNSKKLVSKPNSLSSHLKDEKKPVKDSTLHHNTMVDGNFYIKKTLKERYLVQACKPLPEKYPWGQ